MLVLNYVWTWNTISHWTYLFSLHNNYGFMIKYILPAIIIFLIVLFWEKITEIVLKKFNIRLNYIIVSAVLIAIAIIVLLINL